MKLSSSCVNNKALMKSFDIFYAGQLRFVECVNFHHSFIYGYSSIYAALNSKIFTVLTTNIGGSYSINNLTFDASVNYFKNTINVLEKDIAVNSAVELLSTIPLTNKSFHMQRIVTLLGNLRPTSSMYVVVTSTDSIFLKEQSVLKILDSINDETDPCVYGIVFNGDQLMESSTLILNVAAVDLILSLTAKNICNSLPTIGHAVEDIWRDIFNYLGIKIVALDPTMRTARLKPNMVSVNLNEIDQHTAANLLLDWAEYKRQYISQNYNELIKTIDDY